MSNYRRGAHTIFEIKYHLVWVTKYRCRVLTGGSPGSRVAMANVSGVGRSDREGACYQGSCTRVGVESSDRQCIEADEEDKRSVVAQATARGYSPSEKILGEALLGAGVFLRDARPGDRRSDKELH